MTESTKLHTRYARMYAAGILALLAVTVAGTAWTQAPIQSAMDVSAIMSTIDIGSLPIQGHIDAF